MKKTLLITLLLIPFLGIAQPTKPIEGFLGIKFGTSKIAVIAAMKAKGAKYDAQNSDKNAAAFSNVKLGHRNTYIFFVKFFNDKAYFALFDFVPEEEPQTIEYYKSLVSDLNEVYGAGVPYSDFKSPFKDGDGHEVLALQQGYATLNTDWQSGTNSVQVSINNKINEDKLSVVAIYQNDTIAADAASAQKAKEKSDY